MKKDFPGWRRTCEWLSKSERVGSWWSLRRRSPGARDKYSKESMPAGVEFSAFLGRRWKFEMMQMTGLVLLKGEWKEFGEGDKKRRVFFGVAGDTDTFCQYQVNGEAPADLAVGDKVAFRATKAPECSNVRWGIRYEGVITREKH